MHYASKLSQADPGQILSKLVHRSVFSLLELAQPLPEPERTETDDLLTLIYRGGKGHILFRNDGIRVLIQAFFGEKEIMRGALRDRQLDGTDARSPLTFFPNTDPACNRLPAKDFLAAELSIYSWDPDTFLAGLNEVGTLGHFIADPDLYVWKEFDAETFFPLWEQAFYIGRAPWQTARPMSGVATFFVKQSAALLKSIGYHRLDAVPSWFNVARFFVDKLDYKFTYGEHEAAYDAIVKGLKQFGSLDASQQSWLVALQNVPEAYLPAALKLPARWPVTHTNMYWVRVHLDLNPYTAPTKVGKLTERIAGLKTTPAEPVEPVLHGNHNCPCMHTLGASSPAATSPAATDHAVDATPVPKDGGGTDATPAPKAGASDTTAAPGAVESAPTTS